ncbi:MAG TPA: hypothetical protein VH500_13580 [Nitrososphaeraceae archaeon]
MTNVQRRIPYDERDYAIMANNVYNQLCRMDREVGIKNGEPQWHDIITLAEMVGEFDNRVHVAHLAETVLEERGYLERDKQNKNVRLTLLGRQNCDNGIDIPPSDIQRLKKLEGT